MNEKGIQKVADLAVAAESKVVDIGGVPHGPAGLTAKYIKYPTCEALKLSTLSGLVDYLRADPDFLTQEASTKKEVRDLADLPLAPIVHVVSPTRVELRGRQREDDHRTRDVFVIVEHKPEPFAFGSYIEREMFQIMMMTRFGLTAAREEIISLVGNIVDEQAITTKDDGVTAEVTARTGIVGVGKVKVPNPVGLAPFRSFPEIVPVTSDFVFRVAGGKGAPIKCALFEADGGRWALDTVQSMTDWLDEKLASLVADGRLFVVR